MARETMDWLEAWPRTVEALDGEGALLLVPDPDYGANPMTIGWATCGPIWGRHIFVTLVRPSRHTYRRFADAADFTVCVLPHTMADVCAYCGTKSGRDVDKVAQCGLTLEPATQVQTPVLAEAIVTWECRLRHQHDLDPATLDPDVKQRCYASGDFHRLFYGEIVAVTADRAVMASGAV